MLIINLFFKFLIYSSLISSHGSFLPRHNTSVAKDSTVTISLTAIGDLMCHSVQFNYAHVEGDSFDFRPVFRFVKPILSNSDITFGNLETVVAGKSKKYSGYPYFNCPDEFISALKNAGFKVLNTANNHALDQGVAGIKRTIEQLNKNDLSYEGTFSSQKDSDSLRIFNVKGIKFGFLSYSYGTNGNLIPKNEQFIINLIDTNKIKNDISRIKKDSVDLVIVHFHFGVEYHREPTKFQKEIVKKTIKYGADIIIGDHPHVVEPLKFFKTHSSKLDSGIVAYSLGNFLSNQRWRYSDGGVILKILIKKKLTNDSLYINTVKIMPTWVFRGKTINGNEFIILPDDTAYSDSTVTFLTRQDSVKMNQSFDDTREILMRYIKSSAKIDLPKSLKSNQ